MTNVALVYHKDAFTAYDAEKMVKAASVFTSDITLLSGQKRANMKSIIGLISIQLKKGEPYIVSADGEDEKSAAEELAQLLADLE